MKFTYHREQDRAYVELVPDWKGTCGGSNLALVQANGDAVEMHIYFSESISVQAVCIAEASRWLDPRVLDEAEPFTPYFAKPS